jgi:diacylglycerol kinase
MKNKFEFKQALHHDFDPIRKFKVIWNGFWYVMKYDLSVTYKVILSILLLFISLSLRQYTNFMLLVIASGNMMSMEIMNSCVELLCDFHKTGYDERIKVIKDVAAVAAGISILVWVTVIVYEIVSLLNIFVAINYVL